MEIPIPMPKCFIGRGDDCHIRPQSQLISRRHCVIVAANGSATIEDCGGANGTLVNGNVHSRRHVLAAESNPEVTDGLPV
jgi:pSer/pThr/pTyr-binding forkhead associated (FHA) protein